MIERWLGLLLPLLLLFGNATGNVSPVVGRNIALGDDECAFTCAKFPGTKPQARKDHTPRMNGCGASGGLDVPDFEWTECCNVHDVCYETCLYPRDDCDSEMYACMLDVCGSDALCKAGALIYYEGVSGFGCGAYLNAQELGCHCAGLFDDEINSMDFGRIIGAPLIAAIEAQSQAARMTVDFLHEVGFELDDQNNKVPIYATFTYEGLKDGNLSTFTMMLPILTMVPIPYMEIRLIDIDFNIKLSQVLKRETDKSSVTEKSFSRSASFLGLYSYEIKGGSTTKEQLSQSEQLNRDYDLRVRVQARSRPVPAGTSAIFDLFEEIMTETPRTTP